MLFIYVSIVIILVLALSSPRIARIGAMVGETLLWLLKAAIVGSLIYFAVAATAPAGFAGLVVVTTAQVAKALAATKLVVIVLLSVGAFGVALRVIGRIRG